MRDFQIFSSRIQFIWNSIKKNLKFSISLKSLYITEKLTTYTIPYKQKQLYIETKNRKKPILNISNSTKRFSSDFQKNRNQKPSIPWENTRRKFTLHPHVEMKKITHWKATMLRYETRKFPLELNLSHFARRIWKNDREFIHREPHTDRQTVGPRKIDCGVICVRRPVFDGVAQFVTQILFLCKFRLVIFDCENVDKVSNKIECKIV